MPKGRTSYAQVQSNGSVLFDFPGHISADGIDMLAGDDSAPPADRKIRWHKTTKSGAVVAEVSSYRAASGDSSITLSALPSGASIVSAVLASGSSSGALAQVIASTNPSAPAGYKAAVSVSSDDGSTSANVQVIDAQGRSEFPRWAAGPTATAKKVAISSALLTFTGSNFSAPLNVNTGLNSVFWGMCCGYGPSELNVVVSGYPGGGTLTFTGNWTTGVVTGTANFFWMAIGA